MMRKRAVVRRKHDVSCPARLQYALDFPQGCLGIVHVLQDVVAQDDVEGVIFVRNVILSAWKELNVSIAKVPGIGFGLRDHVRERLDATNPLRPPRELDRFPAVAAAEVEV